MVRMKGQSAPKLLQDVPSSALLPLSSLRHRCSLNKWRASVDFHQGQGARRWSNIHTAALHQGGLLMQPDWWWGQKGNGAAVKVRAYMEKNKWETKGESKVKAWGGCTWLM